MTRGTRAAGRGRFLSGAAAALAFAVSALPGHAQEWPTRVITLVVPYTAGGSADVPARLFAKELSAKLGQQVIIENKPGASGAIGMVQVAKAAPDGYTFIIVGTGPAVLNKLINKATAYDAQDMTPVVLTTEIPQILIVNSKLPVNSLKEFVDHAKSKPEGVTVGFGGGTGQLSALLFQAKTGIPTVYVNYRGTGPLVTDIMGSQVDAGFPTFVPQVQSTKALGVTGEERMAVLPDVPTMKEAGIDVVATTWNIMLAPRGLPREIVAKVNGAMNEVLKMPSIQAELTKLGARTLGGTPEQAAKLMADEVAKYSPIVASNKIVGN